MADADATETQGTEVESQEDAIVAALEGESTTDQQTEESDSSEGDTDQDTDADKPADADSDEDSEAADDKTEDEDKPDPKAINRQGYAQRRQIREEVTATLAPPQSVDDLIEKQGLDPTDAKIEAINQERLRDKAVAEITELNTGLRSEARDVARDFPIFSEKMPDGTDNPDYDAKFAETADELWRQSADYKTDESGKVVLQAKTPIYPFYAALAKVRAEGIEIGETRGQKAAEKMLASSEQPAAVNTKRTDTLTTAEKEEDLLVKGLTGK